MFVDNNAYLHEPTKIPRKSAWVEWVEKCQKLNPPPFYCELPDDLAKQSMGNSMAPASTYSYTSLATTSIGTSSTTTTS